MIALKGKKYFHYVSSLGREFTASSKVKIEVEKLRWDLKNQYQDLGKYVTLEMEINSTIDFSHDKDYLHKINEIIKTQTASYSPIIKLSPLIMNIQNIRHQMNK